MRTSRWLLIVPLAIIVSVACGGRAGNAQGNTQQINVVLTCPPDLAAAGAGGATANPYIRTASAGDTISWRLVSAGGGNGSDDFTVSSQNWPLPDASYSGTDQIDVTVPQGAAAGTYKYSISMQCNGVDVVLDPGMRIG